MAPVIPSSLSQQTLDNTIGALMLGMIAATLIFGITTQQTMWYYKTFCDDSLLHKVSVAVLWVFDTVHLSMAIHAVYTYTVTGFGNANAFDNIPWSLKVLTSINVVINLIVDILYAMRVWRLSGFHHGILGYIVASVVLFGFAVGVAFTYNMCIVSTFTALYRVSWLVEFGIATTTSIDFLISAAMWYYLRMSKGNQTTLNSRISTVIQYSLCSGLITSACSLSALFTYILLPKTFIFLALEFLVTKLYAVSFIAMLNARVGWKNRAHGETYHPQSTIEPSWRRSGIQSHNLHVTSSFWSPGVQNTYLPGNLNETRPPSPDYDIAKPPTSFYAI